MRTRRLLAVLTLTIVTMLSSSGMHASAVHFGDNPYQSGMNVLIMGSSTTGCAGSLTPPDKPDCYVNLVKAERSQHSFQVMANAGSYVAYGTDPAHNWTETEIPTGKDVVIVQLGVNDWYVPVAPATYRAQLDDFLGRIRIANMTARIYWLMTWMPNVRTDSRMSMWLQHQWVTADALKAVGGEYYPMPGDPAQYASTVPADNGWHYNIAGHRALANAVEMMI